MNTRMTPQEDRLPPVTILAIAVLFLVVAGILKSCRVDELEQRIETLEQRK